jgi:predicted DCC family thiol-disulfide oxidoreductase YuxK
MSARADAFEIALLYDGECPLCAREIAGLRRLDRGRGRLRFVDIAAPGFDASRYGRTRAELMARIHGALPDGRLVEGMEVFRRAYAAVGLGWLLAPTRWPGLRRVADAAYRWFARNRLRLTGRSDACACDAHAPARAAPPRG